MTRSIGSLFLLYVGHLAFDLFEIEYQVLKLFILGLSVMLAVSGSPTANYVVLLVSKQDHPASSYFKTRISFMLFKGASDGLVAVKFASSWFYWRQI